MPLNLIRLVQTKVRQDQERVREVAVGLLETDGLRQFGDCEFEFA